MKFIHMIYIYIYIYIYVMDANATFSIQVLHGDGKIPP